MKPSDLPGSNIDRLRRMQAEPRRTPAMSRALDRTLSIEERRAALEEAAEASPRHTHPGQGWHSHGGPRFHEHLKP